MKNQTNHTTETGYGTSAIAENISNNRNSASGNLFHSSGTKTTTPASMRSLVVCFICTFVSGAGTFVGYATVIIPDAEAFVACGDTFVTGVDPIVYCASRADTAAGTIFCHAAPIFRCDDLLVYLHDIFVNETRSLFELRNASVNATRVYFSGRGTIECMYYTILFSRSIHVNATRVYFSVRSNCSNATGVYFRGGGEACSISGVFDKGRSVPVKATRVYFSVKHISDNDAGVFDKGKRETDKATRVYFAMKSPFGSISDAPGRVTGIKSSKSDGQVPATAGIVMQGGRSGRQSAAICRQGVVIACNTDAFVPNADTPGKDRKTQIQLSFTSATAHYIFKGSCSELVINDSNKSCSPIPNT